MPASMFQGLKGTCFIQSYRRLIRSNASHLHNSRNVNNGSEEKPKSSQVLTYCLEQNKASWTSYFVRYRDIYDDQWGMSHFNWRVGDKNFHVLRTGCYPFIKYHCTQRPPEDLALEDRFFRVIKVLNLGIPCLAYGVAAIFLISHQEVIKTPKGIVVIHFLYKESGAQY